MIGRSLVQIPAPGRAELHVEVSLSITDDGWMDGRETDKVACTHYYTEISFVVALYIF